MDGDASGAPAGGATPSPASGSETSVASVHMGGLPDDKKKRKKPADEDTDETPVGRTLADPYGGWHEPQRGTFAGIFSKEF